MKLRALDLFCGAGGATMGLMRAGFHVTGVDINPQPRYVGDAFHQADALTFPLEGFDFIWASPPCQAYCGLKAMWNKKNHPDLVATVRDRLTYNGTPYSIENVYGSPLLAGSMRLCGSSFGLGIAGAYLQRHRFFESNFPMMSPPCQHGARAIGVYGNAGGRSAREKAQMFTTSEWREAMQINWMVGKELTQAIPPAYSHFIGKQALEYIRRAA